MKRKTVLMAVICALVVLCSCETKKEWEQVPKETVAVAPTSSMMSTGTPAPTSTVAPTNTPVPTNTPTPTPTPTPEPEVTLTMVGDILLHTRIHDYSVQENGTYNYDAIFANLEKQISAADIALVNQEVLIGGEELGISGYPAFNAPYEVGDALVNTGFDVVLHATNHALDKGKKGVLRTLAFWEENYPDISVLGIHDSTGDQEELCLIEIEGIRIAILNYTYGTNGISMPEDMPYAVDMLSEAAVIEDLEQANEVADFVIVCPHWGTEYRLKPDNSQKKWADIFLEHGVDLVLGAHPHVIEPIEWLTNMETGEQMLVYYSLGNFVNWTSGTGEGTANRMVGGMAEVTVSLDANGKAYIKDYGVQAVVCHVEQKTNGITVYPLSEYTEELAQKNAIRSQDKNFSRDYCVELCNEIWDDFWN